MKLTPTASTFTRAWPAPGAGSCVSSICMTSGPPYCWTLILRTRFLPYRAVVLAYFVARRLHTALSVELAGRNWAAPCAGQVLSAHRLYPLCDDLKRHVGSPHYLFGTHSTSRETLDHDLHRFP